MALMSFAPAATREDPRETFEQLRRIQATERGRLDEIRRYWKAKQSLPAVIPQTSPREVREMAKRSSINVCEIVVDTLAQSMFVDGFRPGTDGPPPAEDLDVWEVWQANRFAKHQSALHRATFAYGTAYVLVLPGDPVPVLRARSPRQVTAMYGEDPDWPMWALERFDSATYRLYDDTSIWFYGADNSGAMKFLERRDHDAGVCPVVRFRDSEDLDLDDDIPEASNEVLVGQIAPLRDLQDQINMTTFGLLVAQHYSAFKQRWILGWTTESENEKMQAAASQIWTIDEDPDTVQLGEFDESDLSGYLESREKTIKYAATLAQMPVHELVGQLINLSAEALAAAEASRERKVDEHQTGMGESHKQVFQLVGRLTGLEVPSDVQVIWRDTSARAFGAVVDGLVKLATGLNIPVKELWRMVPGATQKDVERWLEAYEEGGSLDRLRETLQAQMDGDVGEN